MAGMNAVPMPRPSSTIAGSSTVAYEESISIRVSSSMPSAATRKPGPISSRGATRVISRVPICVDPTIMPTIIGRKAKPVLTGEYCCTTWR